MPWNMIITAKEVRSYNFTEGLHLEFNAQLCHCTIMLRMYLQNQVLDQPGKLSKIVKIASK